MFQINFFLTHGKTNAAYKLQCLIAKHKLFHLFTKSTNECITKIKYEIYPCNFKRHPTGYRLDNIKWNERFPSKSHKKDFFNKLRSLSSLFCHGKWSRRCWSQLKICWLNSTDVCSMLIVHRYAYGMLNFF